MTCCSPEQTGLLAELADIDVLMKGMCFGERAVEELELQDATKVLYTLKIIQKTNCCAHWNFTPTSFDRKAVRVLFQISGEIFAARRCR